MRLANLWTVIALCCAVATAEAGGKTKKAAPVDLKGKTVAQVFRELLPGMGAADPGTRREPQQRWQQICLEAGAPGNEKLRQEVCALMTDRLGPPVQAEARVWLLKQLEQVGRAESVAATAAALDAEEDTVRDAAARALAANPAPEATAALTKKLPDAGKHKVALLNALAYRADKAAVGAIAQELTSEDRTTAIAAARALGRIPAGAAITAVANAREAAQGPALLAIGDAALRHADRLLADKQADGAALLYLALAGPKEPRPLRLAALTGLLKASGDRAGERALELLADKDADARAIALGQIPSLNPAAVKTVTAGMNKLPPAGQAALLGALAARGDKAQLPVALAATKSQDEQVRRAGFLAAGRLGDAAAVPGLVDTMFTDSPTAGLARDALTLVSGDGVDAKIIAALKGEKNTDRRAKLIGVVEARKAAAAVPVLLEDARAADAKVRGSAMNALRQLVDQDHVPELVKVLLRAPKGGEREGAERAIEAACRKIPEADRRAEPVLTALASGSAADRAALLPVLGRLGGPKAREVVKAALADGGPEGTAAAIWALVNWPDPSVADDLLQLAQSAESKEHRRLALHALVRVTAMPGDRPEAEKLARLKKAMAQAQSADDRKAILQGVGTTRHIEALRFAVPYLDDKELAQAACKAVVELAHSQKLRRPNQAEFNPALDRVIATCRDRGLVERAEKYRRGQ
jgi:HEAT repeat protein